MTKQAEKLDFTLMPVEFEDVVLVLMNGAKKYEAHGWEEGKAFEKEQNLASIRRHISDYRSGLQADTESGLHPLLHVACRALMQYTLDKRKEYEFSFTAENITELKAAGFSDESIESLRRGLEDAQNNRVSDYKPGCFDDEEHEYCLQNRYSQGHPNLNHSDDCSDSNESQ